MLKKYLRLMAIVLSLSFVIACSDENDDKTITPPDDSTLVDDSTDTDDSTNTEDSTATNDSTGTDVTDSITWSPIEIEYEKHIIDDFEDRDSESAQGGGWYNFSSPGSFSYVPMFKNDKGEEVIVPTGEGRDSDYSLIMTYALHKADYEWAPYAAIATTINDAEKYDASEYVGIIYYYRGAKHIFRTEINAIEDYDVHVIEMPQSAEWKKAEILFSDLQQEGWGDPVDFDPTDIRCVTFNVVGADGDTSFLEVDDIEFTDTIIVELQYDMEIKDPAIPELDSLGDMNLITTPLKDKALKDLDKGVNLTNWLEENKKFDGTFRYDRERIAKMASQGFKAIRFPIDLDLYIDNRDEVLAGTATTLEMDPVIYTVIDSMIAWTAENNMSLTIDYHQYDGSLTPESVEDPFYMAMASKVWKVVADKYKDSRDNIYYELTNEPGIGSPVPNKKWEILAKQMLDSIRTVDTKHTVIYGPSRWYDIAEVVKMKPFDDENVIYAFHTYEPFIFTHMGASWSDMGTTKNIPFPYSKEEWSTEYSYFGFTSTVPSWCKSQLKSYYKTGNKEAIKNTMIAVKNWAIENNVVLVANEFGAHTAKAKNEHIVNYLTAVNEVFTELEIPWQVWFGTFDGDGDLIDGVGDALGL